MPPLQQSAAGADLHCCLHWCSQLARHFNVGAPTEAGSSVGSLHRPGVCALICRLLLCTLCTALH